ncbi:DUF2242 domain-containing protein [Variovorax sp.]|uniref:DUF2242 domain-containing protein n=1 Tax=Variovorax sp. TaxID=1871043 RepID=UPI002D28B8A8|nr:DUF2242 domain-containing protein [Variovorax sp.]HYP81840.1 DUF2242 domain-containing protein [Variovorax sp.]
MLALAGCGTSKEERIANYAPETFNSTDAHSRDFPASEAQVCEAARRALLSQGYQLKDATSQQVRGVKGFQPENEVHMEVQMQVVCAADAKAGGEKRRSTAFVSAVQDRFALKKSPNSASVGVGVLGSVSLPYSASDDSMVKVASATVSDDQFYERFYALIDRYLTTDGPDPKPPPAPAAGTPADPVASGKKE